MRIDVRAAMPEDFGFLKSCWTECFDDDERYVDWNFNYNYTYSDAIVAEYDGITAAAMYCIPYTLMFEGCEIPARYISGVGTMPNFRNSGLVRRLFEYGLPLIHRDGCAMAFLVSAVDGMYEKFGFAEVYKRAVYSARSVGNGRTYNKNEIDIDKISRIYRCQTENTLHIDREIADWKKLIDEMADAIGGFAAVDDKSYCFAFDDKDGGEVYEKCGNLDLSPIKYEPFMARVIDAKRFLEIFSSRLDKNTVIAVSDEYISQNNGIFVISDRTVTRLNNESRRQPDFSFTTAELCRFVLSKIPIFIGNII